MKHLINITLQPLTVLTVFPIKCDCSTGDDMPKIRHLESPNKHFVCLPYTMLLIPENGIQKGMYIFYMPNPSPAKDKDIIEESNPKLPRIWAQNFVHQGLKGGRCVA